MTKFRSPNSNKMTIMLLMLVFDVLWTFSWAFSVVFGSVEI